MNYLKLTSIAPTLKGKYVKLTKLHLCRTINGANLKLEPGSIGLIYSVMGFGKIFVGFENDFKTPPSKGKLLTCNFAHHIELYADSLYKFEVEQ